ncbi:hypothetical protein F5I97DRAFT_1648458 [Phlebopus sp. FC_14]|nr:hypothetical protein F5I97DRAFT_1648458 [Phlebopus sp. FC_14]
MALSRLLLLAIVALGPSPSSSAMVVHPNVLVPVSNATCLSDYAWMNNEEGYDPCLTVAYVIAACAGDTWTQPALPSGYTYDPPNGTTATPCYCSWSCYNLMMGCTLCQGSDYTSDIETWAHFSQNCPSSYSDVYFPSGYELLGDASIPYWSSIDPNTWTSAVFNYEQAQSYANEDKPDLRPSVSSGSGSNSINIGAIVGGTVGGAAALLILGIGGYILYKRRKYSHMPGSTDPSNTPSAAWLSDSSTAVFSQSNTPRSPPPTFYTTVASPPPPTETATYTTTNSTGRNQAVPMV